MTYQTSPEPVLLAHDLNATAQFYANQLRFRIHVDSDSLKATRDGMSLRICQARGGAEVTGVTALLQITDVRMLHMEYRANYLPGVTGLLTVRKKPLQFSLKDINGNYLLFVGPQPALVVLPDGPDMRGSERQYG